MQTYKCCICGENVSLYLTVHDGEENLGSYCSEFECLQKAMNTIGALKDRVAMKAMKKAT